MNAEAIARIGPFRHWNDAGHFSTVAHVAEEVQRHGRSGTDSVVKCGGSGWRGDVERLAGQPARLVEPFGPNTSNRLGTDFLEILDRRAADCAEAARNQHAGTWSHSQGIDRLA